MTRSFVPFSWGIATGVGVCFALWIVAVLVALGGYSGFIPAYSAYLWPSSLLLPGDFESQSAMSWIMLIISVAANALLYGALFTVVRVLAHLLRKRKSDV
jgi:hypothetical protein